MSKYLTSWQNWIFKAVQAAADGIELVLQLFPKTARMLTELNVDSTYLMSTAYEGRINFHPERFKHKGELEKTARADAESGFHPKNTGIREYGAHEAAHIVLRTLIDKGKFDWNNGVTARKIVQQAYSSLGTEKSAFQCRCEISKYASKYDKIDECIAEAFSDYAANERKASALSRAILNLIRKELQGND